jgi:hypothetical protein
MLARISSAVLTQAWLEFTEPERKELHQIEPRIAAVLKPHPESLS